MQRLAKFFPKMGGDWTRGAVLPGGEIPNADYVAFSDTLRAAYPWMPRALVNHYGHLYGARTRQIVGNAASLAELGRHFGGNLYEAEVRYLVAFEWARAAEDVLMRRTKEGLRMTAEEKAAFSAWFDAELALAA